MKIKVLGLLIGLFVLIASFSVFAEDDIIKVDGTIYVESLTSEQRIIKELDDNNKIEFKVGKNSYALTAFSVKPTNVKLTLKQSGETIIVNIGEKVEYMLPDGSTLFLKYLEYGKVKSKLAMWANVAQGQEETEEKKETKQETDTKEVKEETVEVTEEETTENQTVKEKTLAGLKSKLKPNTKWLALLAVVALLVIIGLIIYYNMKESHLVG